MGNYDFAGDTSQLSFKVARVTGLQVEFVSSVWITQSPDSLWRERNTEVEEVIAGLLRV